MAMTRSATGEVGRLPAALLVAALLLPVAGQAQTAPGASVAPEAAEAPAPDAEAPAPDAVAPAPAPDAAAAPAPTLEPPHPLTSTSVPYPGDAPPHEEAIVVRVKLAVGVDGLVQEVTLLTPTLPAFDAAVVAAAKQFRFSPALYGGQPVAVDITFAQTFRPPPPAAAPPPEGGPAQTAALRGRLVEKGTRAPVAGATVAAEIDGKHYTAEADKHGRFRLPLPPGEARVTVHAAGYLAFLQREQLTDGQELAVAYYVERERYDPYEILVYGEKRREELSRVTLRGPELTQVPGTFGDPFRVVQTLPGVASIVSLLPFPVVRGSSPSSTGMLLDGTRVPLLYHLLAGPSVIHPEFIDEIDFYPGGAPVIYGGYTAGIVDGRTRRARADESLIDLDVNFLQTGALVRQPVHLLDGTFTAAGRVGYPGVIMSLATNQASLSYWDYQLRWDGGTPRNGYTIFAFGASDEVDTPAATADPNDPDPPLEPSLRLTFHRLDLRAMLGSGKLDGLYRVVLGLDDTLFGASTGDIRTLVLEPSTRWHYRLADWLELVAGLEGSLHDTTQSTAASSGEGGQANLGQFTQDLSRSYVGSALTEAFWRPTPSWLVRPGVRVDSRNDGTTTLTSADPRLMVRYLLLTRDLGDEAPDQGAGQAAVTPGAPAPADDEAGVWLKGGVGLFHQPPRFLLPLPGLDTMPLSYGLLSAIQSSLGVEVPFTRATGVNVEGFFNYMDPVVFDLSTNAQVSDVVNSAPGGLPGTVPQSTGTTQNEANRFLDRLANPETGRSYGAELLLRRRSTGHGMYGWISYTLSRSERKKDGEWVAFDYDRSHLLNLVVGLPLPRNWDIGLRLQYESGKPATTTYGYNTARTDSYFRFDARIDKRAVWNKWLLDFYVDLTNAALFPEEVSPGQTIRYVLPTLGLRGRL